MFEWYEAVFLFAAGAVLSLVGSYIQRLWSRKDKVEEDEREAQRRDREEQQAARRQHRKERVKAYIDYLDLAGKVVGAAVIRKSGQKMYADNMLGVQQNVTEDDWLKGLNSRYPRPNVYEMTGALFSALSVARTGEMRQALMDVMVPLAQENVDGPAAMSAIAAAEKMVEDFISSG